MDCKKVSEGVNCKRKDFDGFCFWVTQWLESYFLNGTQVECIELFTNNDMPYVALCIKEPGTNYTTSMSIAPYYEMHLRDMELEVISREIIDCYEEVKGNMPFDTNLFYNYEWIKERIGFKLVNYEKNEEMLKNMPHVSLLDLAVTAFVDISDLTGVPSTFSVLNQHMDAWNIEGMQLLKDAVDNMARRHPAELHAMSEVLDELSCGNCEKEEMEIPMHVLTNASKNWGAGCILYPGMLRTCIERVGKEFYILPSSVHEIILMPYDAAGDPEMLIHMVRDVNKTEVPSFDILSDHIYKYDEVANVISMLDIQDCCEEGEKVIVCNETNFLPFSE